MLDPAFLLMDSSSWLRTGFEMVQLQRENGF